MTRKTEKNRRNIYIYQSDYDYLAEIGGTYSEGLREAVKAHKFQSAMEKARRENQSGEGEGQ